MGMVRLISVVIIFFAVLNVSAQRVNISTNLADTNFGTLSGEVSFAASRHISVNAEYDTILAVWFTGERFIQNHQSEATRSAGRIYSPLVVQMRTQVREYNCGGVFGRQITEGSCS